VPGKQVARAGASVHICLENRGIQKYAVRARSPNNTPRFSRSRSSRPLMTLRWPRKICVILSGAPSGPQISWFSRTPSIFVRSRSPWVAKPKRKHPTARYCPLVRSHKTVIIREPASGYFSDTFLCSKPSHLTQVRAAPDRRNKIMLHQLYLRSQYHTNLDTHRFVGASPLHCPSGDPNLLIPAPGFQWE